MYGIPLFILNVLAHLPFFGKRATVPTTPNVLFIFTDDQDLHLNSMDYMPKVQDKLGQHGLTFQNHYCTSAFCCPSRISLFTGKCVHNTNVTDIKLPYGGYPKFVSEGLNDDYLPLWLQDGGINSYYIGKFSNGHTIHNYLSPPARGWTGSNFLLKPGIYDYLNTTWAKDNGPWRDFPGEHAIDVITRNTMEMLDTAVNDGKPFFMTVAPAVPHNGINSTSGRPFFPYPQPKWANAFPDAQVPRTPNFSPDEPSGASWLLNLPPQDQYIIDGLDILYRARLRVVAGLDDMVGDIVDKLDELGILDNTHIVYSTDNGYHIGQHRLGGGKKTGYETDINIPMVWRGPGVPAGKVTQTVTTHTDLAPTWLSLFGLPLRTKLDGRPIPDIVGPASLPSGGDGEHVNVELWGAGAPYEMKPYFGRPRVEGSRNNTYKGLRLVADEYSLYYSVWCTNEHELYDMEKDHYQMQNLLPRTYDIQNVPDNQEMLGRPLNEVVTRLDALMMVLKSCVGSECTHPWNYLHPMGDVNNLREALDHRFDSFYAKQPKVSFAACKLGYLVAYEGPQTAMQYWGP